MDIDKKPREEKKPAFWQPALILFAKFSGWIAVPVLLGAFFGKWLDEKYNSEPWFFLGLVGLAFFISMIGLARNAMEEYRKIEKASKQEKEKNDSKTS